MSQSVLTNLDLNQNQIENAAVHNLSEAPTNPVKGQQYFNTVDNVLYYYDGTNWVSGDSITIDSALSTTSENPVQNKVITTNMVKGVTGSNATVTVTKGDNTTSTFTINNVDNATTATKATQDGDGNVISSTYIKTSTKGAANGVASLDADTKIPEAQIPDKFVRGGSILLDLSAHSLATPRRIFQEKLDDCLYCADKRHTVTLTNFSRGYASSLFDGNSDTHCGITKGQIGVVSIQGSINLGMGYPYGYIYCNFYYGGGPQNLSDVTCRVYQNWSGHNVGWVTLTGEEVASQTFSGVKSITTLRFPTNVYGINQIEVTLDNTNGTATTETTDLRLNSISFFCNRTGVHSLPVLTKWGGDTVYGNLTIPTVNGSFIGNLTGIASKATADANGNTISSTYLKTANYYPAQTGSFTTSNWTSSNGKYTYTISLTKASPSANIVLYDSNNKQVLPEDVTLTKSSGNVTSIIVTIGADPDCRFAGTYNITF